MDIEDICQWRASEVSGTLSRVYKFEFVWYIYTVYGYGGVRLPQ